MHFSKDSLQRCVIRKTVNSYFRATAANALPYIKNVQIPFLIGEIAFSLGKDHVGGNVDSCVVAMNGYVSTLLGYADFQRLRMTHVMFE